MPIHATKCVSVTFEPLNGKYMNETPKKHILKQKYVI